MTQELDREFEQYLEGGSHLSDAYAGLPPAEPPAYLDYAIRAEAHSVVGERASRVRARTRDRDALRGWSVWQKWTMPLSMVAMLVVVVLVGLELPYMPREALAPGPAPQAAPPAAPQAIAPPPIVSTAPAMKQKAGSGAMADNMKQEAAGRVMADKKPAAPAQPLQEHFETRATGAAPAEVGQAQKPAPAPQAAPSPAAEMQAQPTAPAAMEAAPAAMEAAPAAAMEAAPARRMKAAPAPAAVAPSAAATASVPAARAPASGLAQTARPQAWLEHIRQLRRNGQRAEAKTELAAFRKRYPDYSIPEELRDLQ